jgi:hypothetical protein
MPALAGADGEPDRQVRFFAEPAGEYGNMAQIAVESARQGYLLGLAKNFLGRGSGSVYAWSGVAWQ